MGKVFIIDLDYCNGCYSCQYACKDEHVGNEWAPYALPQPNTGQFWMKVEEWEHGSKPRVRVEYQPTPCMHCDDAPCMKAFPEAFYKREDGLVILDPAKAKGVEGIEDACPYGAIFYNAELGVAQKCTGCAHLVDEGKLPHCVDLCGQEALKFGDEADFADKIAQAEVLQPELGTKPRVYYLNRPHLFVNGEVWDPEANEVVIGAEVELTCPDGTVLTEATDEFGEFWFKRIDAGTYALAIQAEGFAPVTKEGIVLTDKGVNLGDFPLGK